MRRPVLLIDGGSRGDIGVIRSLGLGAVPVHLLVADPRSPSASSRYVTGVHPFPGLDAPDDACVRAIRAATRTLDARPVMLATGDRALALMSRTRDVLADVLDHDLAAARTIDICLHKDRFAAEAARLGLAVPETFVPASIAEARARADGLPYPVFVKPVDRAEWDRLPRAVVPSVKGQRCDSPAELRRLLDALAAAGLPRFIVQRFVGGDDHEHVDVHAYVLPDGRVAGAFTGVKLRLSPPHAGVGAHVISRRVPEATAVAEHALRALGYTGFANVNLKRDARFQTYQLLEINGRYSTWTELPSRTGCNFPLVAYAAITGEPIPRVTQREGRSWLDAERCLEGLPVYARGEDWDWVVYAKSMASVRYGAYFAWDDPAPFFRKVLRTGRLVPYHLPTRAPTSHEDERTGTGAATDETHAAG